MQSTLQDNNAFIYLFLNVTEKLPNPNNNILYIQAACIQTQKKHQLAGLLVLELNLAEALTSAHHCC